MATPSREFDIIVFGATGYTGQFVVEKLAQVGRREQLTWAVAGRNKSKLQECLAEAEKHVAKKVPDAKLKDTPIVVCDAQNEESLNEMCKRTRLVLNCVGPYAFYGEPVVRACIANGTHHLDVSGEIAYHENIASKFGREAEERGLFVISACGFDSVPIEAVVHYAEEQFAAGALNDVETYLQLKAGPVGYTLNYGTLHSMVNMLAHGDLGKADAMLKASERDFPPARFHLPNRSTMHHRAELHTWAIPFYGSDRVTVYRSQNTLWHATQHRPIHVMAYIHAGSLSATLGLSLGLAHIFVSSKISPMRHLLLKHPKALTAGNFSKEGPTREQIEQCTFTYTAFARGWSSGAAEEQQAAPSRLVRVDLHGHDFGYVTTALCLVEAAVSVLKETDRLTTRGGVLTVDGALHNTDYFKRLQNEEDGFRVEVSELKPKK